MRKMRLLELMTNYDIDMQYYPSKINVIPNALSRKRMTMFLMQHKELLEKIKQLDLNIVLPGLEARIMVLQPQPPLVKRIKEVQKDDPKL